MKNRFLNELKKRNNGTAGRLREKFLEKDLKGRATIASGALPHDKGDVVHSNGTYSFRSESKTTQAESISLKLDWLLKIQTEALNCGELPSLIITFVHENGKARTQGEWVMIPYRLFKEVFCEDL